MDARTRRGSFFVATVTLFATVTIAAPAIASADSGLQPRASLRGRGHRVHRGNEGEVDVNVCSDEAPVGFAHCDAHVRTDVPARRARPSASAALQRSYDPSYLQSAYNAPSATSGFGQTVAIVDAYDAPNAAADLAVYRQQFGLPPCTTASGCFRKIDEHGGTHYPVADAGWAEEISLDVDMVSAICPNCNILLVEATTASIADLGTAVNEAVALGANAVSNSYGAPEFSFEAVYDSYYNHPGVAIVASSGDSGYGVSYPAASPNVVAVGGTSLQQATNTGTRDATETVWSRAGSGCSAYEPKPAWQTDSGCTGRTVADVSAVADPATGVLVYDSADGGFEIFGGTSVSSPIIASFYALAGNGASTDQLGSYPYAHPTSLNDIVSGSNGSCGGSYLCTGKSGYDGPTGLGTPTTAAAFASGVVNPPPAADFSLTASPVAPVLPGANVKSTLTVTRQGSFTGTVKLAATVTPSTGLTAGLSANSLAMTTSPRTSTLTLTGHTGGNYTVTVTATSGALVHTTSLTVSVNDYTITLSPAKTSVVRGQQVQFTVTLGALGAFNSPVTLTVTGVPTNDIVTISQSPSPVPGVQTVTITTWPLYAAGSMTVHVNGASGNLKHTASATLVVQK